MSHIEYCVALMNVIVSRTYFPFIITLYGIHTGIQMLRSCLVCKCVETKINKTESIERVNAKQQFNIPHEHILAGSFYLLWCHICLASRIYINWCSHCVIGIHTTAVHNSTRNHWVCLCIVYTSIEMEPLAILKRPVRHLFVWNIVSSFWYFEQPTPYK